MIRPRERYSFYPTQELAIETDRAVYHIASVASITVGHRHARYGLCCGALSSLLQADEELRIQVQAQIQKEACTALKVYSSTNLQSVLGAPSPSHQVLWCSSPSL